MKKDVTIATITNAAFIILALALWETTYVVWAMALCCVLLGVLSGLHHWNLGKEFLPTSVTKKGDYLGMYLVATSLFVAGFGYYGIINLAITVPIGLFLVISAGASRAAVGIGIIGVLGMCVHFGGFTSLTYLLPWLALAFVGNFIGDNIHNEYHSILHGIWWHIVIIKPLFDASLLIYL